MDVKKLGLYVPSEEEEINCNNGICCEYGICSECSLLNKNKTETKTYVQYIEGSDNKNNKVVIK